MKKVVFFHNRHDQESIRMLERYLSDPTCTVEVYDVFALPPPKMPDKVRVWRYPFIITKQFVVLKPDSLNLQLAAGAPLEVKLGCFALDGTSADPNTESSRLFYVYVDGVLYSDNASPEIVDISGAVTPVLTFTFKTSTSMNLRLRVEAEEYMPFDEVFEIAVG